MILFSPRAQWYLVAAWVAVRLVFALGRQLVPDEAYYWVWSRHLSLSYFDHPGMTAWLIRAGTALAGDTELGVRWPTILLMAAAVLIVAWITRRLIGDVPAATFVPVMLLTCPGVSALGALATPDAPACFFQAAALACALAIFAPDSRTPHRGPLWIAFGISIGLGLLSKYTSILLAAAILAALLTHPQGRRHLRTPWPWLGGMAALVLLLPVLLWNLQHHWASFAYQWRHGMGIDQSSLGIRHIPEYIGSQALVATPILFVLCVAAIWTSRRRADQMHIRILQFASALPLAFFLIPALHRRVEANWPAFAYFPAIMLIACELAENWRPPRIRWAQLAILTALPLTVLSHFPQAIWAINPRWSAPMFDELFGWRELAAKVDGLRGDTPVMAADYQYASELSFYLPGKPTVWPFPDNARMTAYDFFPSGPLLNSMPRLLYVQRIKGTASGSADPHLTPYFAHFRLVEFDVSRQGRAILKSLITMANK